MAQRKPEQQVTLDQVLKLVDRLSPDEQEQLRLKLDCKTRHQEWRNLVAAVSEDNKGLSPLSDEEIAEEVRAVKQDRKAQRAQDSN
ncbi:MAG: hypothetical protein HY711_03570 [Candidatus Melainabacteria bacterium]|nr:hypothetical protein [Candidatus Melainabacteria bacterium]